jgi:hypothetical protein
MHLLFWVIVDGEKSGNNKQDFFVKNQLFTKQPFLIQIHRE